MNTQTIVIDGMHCLLAAPHIQNAYDTTHPILIADPDIGDVPDDWRTCERCGDEDLFFNDEDLRTCARNGDRLCPNCNCYCRDCYEPDSDPYDD